MTIYYYVLVILPMAFIATLLRNRDAQAVILATVTVSTMLIAGMRWASDVDHPDYADMFDETPDLQNFNRDSIQDLHGEPGYLFVSALLKSLEQSFIVLSVACAVASIIIKAFVASKFSRSAGLVICLYLCIHFVTIEFIQIRWAVASALIALAIYFQFQRKLFLAASVLFIATSFHYFSAVFILVCLLAEIRKEKYFNILVVSISIAGLLLAREDPTVPKFIESEAYVVKRTLRYLTDPLSSVGFLSYAKLAMIPFAYFTISLRHPPAASDLGTIYLRRIAFASIGVTLLLSFVPLMHFRAVVVADLFSLLLILRMLEEKIHLSERLLFLLVLSALYAVWYVQDISNYMAADRLYEYKTWIDLLA